MERIDPQAPSLPRLKGGIADIERIAAEHAAEQARAQEAARRLAEKEQAQTLLREQAARSEEHTSELQSLMRISYAVFCLKKKNTISRHRNPQHQSNDNQYTYEHHKPAYKT